MSKVNITISLEVLNGLSPQKGMLNAAAADLEKQVFVLHSTVAPKDKSKDLMSVDDDNSYVKARYMNTKTKKSFLIPIRGLLNLGLVQMGTVSPKVTANTQVTKVNDWLLETAVDGRGVSLPESFYVVSVKNRVQEGTKAVMYPPYCYVAFNEKVEALKKEDPNADLSSIYQNYDFMQGLYSGKLEDRHSGAEATKEIIISI
jgi:hypothetical protein